MEVAALVAAAIMGPAVGAVTAYNAWAVYVSCRERYLTQSNRDGRARLLTASREE